MDRNTEDFRYKWIILFTGVAINFLAWGSITTVGVFYVSWTDFFQDSQAQVAVVTGIASGIGAIFGPVSGAMIDCIGFRKVGFIGALVLGIGQITSALTSNLVQLGFTFGILTGIGSGICNLTSSVALNQYFDKHRSMAEGIASMGVGMGTFLLTIFYQCLINTYGWKGAIAIAGAVSFHLIVLHQLLISPAYLMEFPILRDWKITVVATRPSDYEKEINNGELICTDDKTKSRKCLRNADNSESTDDLRSEYRIPYHPECNTPEPTTVIESTNENFVRRSIQLFKDPVFLLIFASDFLCWICIFVPYVHLAQRSKLEGINVDTAAFISSTIGLAGIAGRPLISSIPTFFKIDPFTLYGIVQVSIGIVTSFSPFFSSVEGLFVYAALLGCSRANYPLIKTSTAFLLGKETFPLAYSWMMFFEGVGVCLGSPLAGWLYDITKSYDYSFYCTGAGLFLSGLLVALRKPAVTLKKQFKSKTLNRELIKLECGVGLRPSSRSDFNRDCDVTRLQTNTKY